MIPGISLTLLEILYAACTKCLVATSPVNRRGDSLRTYLCLCCIIDEFIIFQNWMEYPIARFERFQHRAHRQYPWQDLHFF